MKSKAEQIVREEINRGVATIIKGLQDKDISYSDRVDFNRALIRKTEEALTEVFGDNHGVRIDLCQDDRSTSRLLAGAD